VSVQTSYAITSLTATQASPAGLAAIIRGHWAIEDRPHWVRDIDYDEDRSQVRTASGPRIMAALRNLAITHPAAGRPRQHRRRHPAPRPPPGPAAANDHELLDDVAGPCPEARRWKNEKAHCRRAGRRLA
jgi:hypothetical protein